MKIYESTPGGLYAQPGRTVTTFPSGLIRIDQTYACSDVNVDKINSITTSGGPVTSGDTTVADATYLPLTSESFFNAASGIVIFKSGSSWSIELSSGSWTGGTATDPSGTYTPSGDAVGSFTVLTNTIRSSLAVGNPMPDADASPSIDGLSIFPDPQEHRRGDGFTEFKVSAYGRTTTASQDIQLIQKTLVLFGGGYYVTCNLWQVTGSIVTAADSFLTKTQVGIDPIYYGPASFYVNGHETLVTAVGTILHENGREFQHYTANINATSAITLKIYMSSLAITSQRSFGAFRETSFSAIPDGQITEVITP